MKIPKAPSNIEQLKIDDLLPYATNSRTHSPEQVAQIAASMVEFGWTNPVLIDANGTIVAGHGRVMAARKLGMDIVPCIRLAHLTPMQVKAYVIADNKLALNAGWDEAMLKAELDILKDEGFGLELTGFSDDEIDLLLNAEDAANTLSDTYTHKVDAPLYTPKGEKPRVNELTATEKSEQLIEKIESAKIDLEVKKFLKAAATRHIIFNYEKIAEFYCHADKETQQLMEDSALVIIDFQKALQLGYVKLREEIVSVLENQKSDQSSNE